MSLRSVNPPLPAKSIWSRLPIELLREIILYSASECPQRARAHRLLSRYVNIWVLPLIFHTLTLTTPDHITRFTSSLLPKRRFHVPALKSQLHTLPRLLSSYTIESLALVVNTRLPSIETALENVAPAFARLKNLAITGQNLSSNAYWLRRHPIHPKHVMLLHFGRPQLVNYWEPLFKSVTHLYTSALTGHRGSSVADLPQLTHLAVHTRIDLPANAATDVARQIHAALETAPRLQCLVLVLNGDGLCDPQLGSWLFILGNCLKDKRFFLLPYLRIPRMEWLDMLAGRPNVWERAEAWGGVESGPTKMQYRMDTVEAARADHSALPKLKRYTEEEWEVDLVERVGFSPIDVDPTERLYQRTLFPTATPGF